MKNRPEPKKISYIKVNNNNNNKCNTKNVNKIKKQNNVLINNLIILNSPKKNYNSSSSKINDKLLNKIKQYSLEAQLLNQNQPITNTSQNGAKKKFKYNQENINSISKNNINNELRYNSLDLKNSIPKFKRKISNINKLNTDRNLNPFIKSKNKNNQLHTYSNEKEKTSNRNIRNFQSTKFNNLKLKPHSLSKERKKRITLNTNFKYAKAIQQKTFNIKRNISANNRIIGHNKIKHNFLSNKENIKKDNEEEFNINYNEENENLLFDIHTSYNLTTKNPFNFYNTDIQFRSSKNILEKNNKKINFDIKEENENEIEDNNNSEFSFRKEKNNNSNEKKYFEINSSLKNEINNRNLNLINKKEKNSLLSSLNKNRINCDTINKDALSISEFKGIYTPENLEYSLEKKRKCIKLRNKGKNPNKYYILKNNGIINNNNFTNNFNSESNKLLEKINKNIKNEIAMVKPYKPENENSFFMKSKKRNKNEIDKNKSPSNDKYNYSNYNYHNHKLCFLNSPNFNISPNLNINKNENSYDDNIKRNKKMRFHKILQKENPKEREKRNSNYQSNSHSNSKAKSRAKSHLNKMENSTKYINRLNKLKFIIKTNWGNAVKIGINSIKLLDRNNKSIPIKNANFDITKPYIAKYIKGDIKKLIIGYEKDYNLKNIVILNGFNDSGIKSLMIENDRGKIIWRGNIPKINMINVKKYYIPIDNYNYNSNANKKNLIFSKTIFLNKDENNNLSNFHNFKNMTNTIRDSQNEDNYENSSNNYELCDKIKIKLIENYGNRDYIGLSGIEFYDNNNKLINILENKKNIRINESVVNAREKKILFNLFNNKNDTTDPQYMFLTTNINAFITIEFKHSLKISKIIFYNYNNNIYKECATKGILLYFYYNKKSNKIKHPFYLYRPPGEDNIDYGQTLLYPFDYNIFYEKKIIENKIFLRLNYNKMIYNEEYQYYSPFLPFGHILKIEMISNYGNKNYIGIENIELFDEDNNEIISQIPLNKKSYKNLDYSNDSINNDHKETNNNIKEIKPRIYNMPGAQKINRIISPIILSKFYYFNDANNELGENRIYFIFNECISLSRICINNYNKYFDISAKHIIILLDDFIIFEGDLKNVGNNNIYFCEQK